MSGTLSEVLRRRLVDQQRREDLSDEGMGSRLSLHQGQWTRVRNGVSGLGAKGIGGAAAAYPDLVVESVREVSGREESAGDRTSDVGAADICGAAHLVGAVR